MLRLTLALLVLVPFPALAQETRDIVLGQPLTGELVEGDRAQFGRIYDEFVFSAVPGSRIRVATESSDLAVHVNVYYYDEYFDLIPLLAGGSKAEGSRDFTVPSLEEALVVFRVTTVADDQGPQHGAYTIELSER